NFEDDNSFWSYDKNYILSDSADNFNHYYLIDSTIEWGPGFTANLSDLINNRHQFADVSLRIKIPDNNANGMLVFTLSRNNKNIHWKASEIIEFINTENTDDWQYVYLSNRLTSIFKSRNEIGNIELKVFFWNRNKSRILLDDFIIQFRKGNSKVYGLFEDL
ncbi:MAG: hypothetical protein K8R58_03410, partial [Bacteroidales bacterium]|nr:hypothetical protein [Bacteroidales bacterium]